MKQTVQATYAASTSVVLTIVANVAIATGPWSSVLNLFFVVCIMGPLKQWGQIAAISRYCL